MSEEKKAIEIVKEITFVRGIRKDVEGEEEDLCALEEVLNLIDKLQKELKDSINARFELQRRIDKLQKELQHKQETIDKILKELEEFYKKYDIISKDKIKEALGDKNIPDEMILTYIETLVSENNRLEDIEDRKVQIEYNNVFNKGVKSVEEKIRTEIKELEEDEEFYIEQDRMYEFESKIKMLKELLEDN